MMEIDPIGDLLEMDMYTVVEVSEAAVVRMHASDNRYGDCDCDLLGFIYFHIILLIYTNFKLLLINLKFCFISFLLI